MFCFVVLLLFLYLLSHQQKQKLIIMKTLFSRFVKENKIELPPNFGEISKRFSLWLSGYTDKEKKNKRFQSTYRVNKFMARKWIQKLQ